MQPLVDLQDRGTVWTQKNGRDGSIEAMLTSDDGLSLDVAKDARTKQSLHASLHVLATTPIAHLTGKRLEAEDGVEIIKREVWHNEENHQRMQSIGKLYEEYCGGNFVVPSFYDVEGERLSCNPGSYEHLTAWVL